MVNRCSCHRIDIEPTGNVEFNLGVPEGASIEMDAGNAAVAVNRHNMDASSHPYILNELGNKQNKINDLESIREGASAGLSAIQPNDNITELNNNAGFVDGDFVSSAVSTHDSSESAHSYIRGLVSSETYNREHADIGLQNQIDAITASSDVKDIVGTYAELQDYDTSTLGNNDIIKVLQDETQDDATTYYRWSTTTETFSLISVYLNRHVFAK